ncbi:hypothetical protein LR48_Vigan252s001600 [Vigna angularis]|uniref:Uncharacterized protein n=1 Tax=Phaseolus angularis TaxID=3914 RepID=A0A0L9T880_PHAAN|nr:hypothetical protein LR48_Vigan252s001600 [Vigna angularis]
MAVKASDGATTEQQRCCDGGESARRCGERAAKVLWLRLRSAKNLRRSRFDVFTGDVNGTSDSIESDVFYRRRITPKPTFTIHVGHDINQLLLQLVYLGSVVAPSSFASFVVEKVVSFGPLMAFQP